MTFYQLMQRLLAYVFSSIVSILECHKRRSLRLRRRLQGSQALLGQRHARDMRTRWRWPCQVQRLIIALAAVLCCQHFLIKPCLKLYAWILPCCFSLLEISHGVWQFIDFAGTQEDAEVSAGRAERQVGRRRIVADREPRRRQVRR